MTEKWLDFIGHCRQEKKSLKEKKVLVFINLQVYYTVSP